MNKPAMYMYFLMSALFEAEKLLTWFRPKNLQVPIVIVFDLSNVAPARDCPGRAKKAVNYQNFDDGSDDEDF